MAREADPQGAPVTIVRCLSRAPLVASRWHRTYGGEGDSRAARASSSTRHLWASADAGRCVGRRSGRRIPRLTDEEQAVDCCFGYNRRTNGRAVDTQYRRPDIYRPAIDRNRVWNPSGRAASGRLLSGSHERRARLQTPVVGRVWYSACQEYATSGNAVGR